MYIRACSTLYNVQRDPACADVDHDEAGDARAQDAEPDVSAHEEDHGGPEEQRDQEAEHEG